MLAGDHKASVLSSVSTTGRVDFAYMAYGHRKEEPSGTGAVGFNGELREKGSGCYFLGNGNRVFSPSLMMFQSPDDLSPFEEGGLNAYAYCEGDPVNYLDPTGKAGVFHWAFKRLRQAFGSSSRSKTKSANNEAPKPNSAGNTSSKRLFDEGTASFSDQQPIASRARREQKPIPQGTFDFLLKKIEEGDPFGERNEHNKLPYRFAKVEELPVTPPATRRQLAIENAPTAPTAATSTQLSEEQLFIRRREKNKKPKVIDQARRRRNQ